MKAQKLGWVLGMNMAVACMMMQGCKAHKAGTEPLPSNTTVVAAAPVETAVPAATPTETATVEAPVATSTSGTGTGPSATATPVATSTQPSGIVIEQGQAPTPVAKLPTPKSTVRTVPALPKAGPKPAVAPKGPLATTAPAVAAGSAAAGAGFVYTVKPGDQLFALSRKYNVRLSAIVKANPGLNPDRIRIGQKITIPGVTGPSATAVAAAPTVAPMAVTKTTPPKSTMLAAAPAAPTAASTVAPVKTKPAFKPYVGATKEYTVKSGDSLGKIACESGISIRALKELNKLVKDNVRIGQKLLVPAEKVVKETKTAAEAPKTVAASKTATPAAVKKAESAKTEAKKTEAAPAVETNQPAEAVKVDAAAPAPEKKVEETPAPVVEQKTDPAPVAEPKTDPAPVAEPKAEAPAAAGLTYTVKEGDGLVSVSINFGVSPSQLMDLNGIKAGEGLKPGQVLKIPAGAKPSAD